MDHYLSQRDTDYVRENLVFNYLLGSEQELLLKSYVHNNRIELHFDPGCFYFFMTGTHKKFVNPYTPETFYNGVSNIYLMYGRLRVILRENGYDGNIFLIKEDNSKQPAVLFSSTRETDASPQEVAQKLYDAYLEITTSRKYISTSFVGPYSGYEQIHQAFLDARALNDLLFFGVRDRVITKEFYEQTVRPCHSSVILSNIRKLNNLSCCGTCAKALRQAEYLIDTLLRPSYSMKNYKLMQSICADHRAMLNAVYSDCVSLPDWDTDLIWMLDSYKEAFLNSIRLFFDQIGNRKRYSPTMLYTLSFINRNYTTPLSLTQLSEYININPSSLSSEFNAEVGMSLTEYIGGLRLEHAKRLLAETSETIPEVARQSGYSSAKYFREVFKKQTDLSPQQYRMQMRGGGSAPPIPHFHT